MKTATEILKEGNEGYPIRTIVDNLTDDDILDVITTAQKEAYNEAIRDAGNKLQQTAGQWNSDFALQRRRIFDLLKP